MSERASGGGSGSGNGGGDTTPRKREKRSLGIFLETLLQNNNHSPGADLSLALLLLGTIKMEARSMAENFKCGNLENVSRRLCLKSHKTSSREIG